MFVLRWSLIIGLIFTVYVSSLQCSAEKAEGNATQEESDEDSSADPSEGEFSAAQVLVETISLTPRTMESYILLSSTIETENVVDVYPQVSANVTELLVEEGDKVAKNSLLLLLDDTQLKLAEEKAEVNFRKQDAEYNRVRESYDKKIISEVEFENAKFTLKEAELVWKQAQQELSYTRVTAPIGGVIAERWVRNGDRVQISTKLFQIVDTSEKIARVFIPEKEISKVNRGQRAVIISEFLDKREFKGSIKRISPVVDPESGTLSGTFKITVGITDRNPKASGLRVGMFVTVRIITGVHESIIAVPKDAIVYDSGLPFVYKVVDSTAHKVLLNTGFSDEQFVESLGNLAEGDEIIIIGQSGLKDQTKVKTVASNAENKK